jgi:preprotein translocase subunit SecA
MFNFDQFLHKLFGSPSDRKLKTYRPMVARINDLEPAMRAKGDDALKAMTPAFMQRVDNGEALGALLPEAFAVVRETGRRVMEMRHFDVQLLGGMVLHDGMVAEMRTGEGKTLVATLAVYLNALSRKGVHVVTVNDYLASRDADWMGRIYRYHGLTVGKVLSMDRDPKEKQRAYACDITYGTNNEFGFDYLRDNMKFRAEDYVQRGHNFAIVDEVDSILIDEARTPLIISGPTGHGVDRYYTIDGVIPLLQAEIDYAVDEKAHAVALTDSGIDRIEEKLGIDNLYDPANMELLHHVQQALKAHTLFKRDRDYIVAQGKVVIVDPNTGRLMPGRRWNDGLHQAVEAKEKVTVEPESQTFATITFQNYFRMYGKLAGMTGTAETEVEEFQKIYNLDVVAIPTNKPVSRLDEHDIVYKTQGEKYRAVLDELARVYAKGQPVLVGTVSVEKSDILARLLRTRGIPHEVLNAKEHAREAEIIAQAGRKGSVTISTNMAGRGTDIKLGGDPEGLARRELLDGLTDALRKLFGDPPPDPDAVTTTPVQRLRAALAPFGQQVSDTATEATWATATVRVQLNLATLYRGNLPDAAQASALFVALPLQVRDLLARWVPQCEAEKEEVKKVGGLHILGTERHESRRIDNQLRGRSGRQGDPGSSRFYLSLEDDLLRIFGGDKLVGWMEKMGMQEDERIEHRWITSSIENAQKKVEGHNFNQRKNLLEYDDVMNLQRRAVYDMRRRALLGENIRDMIIGAIDGLVNDIMDECAPENVSSEQWKVKALRNRLERIFGVRWDDVTDEGLRDWAWEELRGKLLEGALAAYERKEAEISAETLRTVERDLLLRTTDAHWKDHLLAMDRLRDGIGLRGYGQKNPLLEYKKEGTDLFLTMSSHRDEAVVATLLRVQLRAAPPAGADDEEDNGESSMSIFDEPGESSEGAPTTYGDDYIDEGETENVVAAAADPEPPPPPPAPPKPGAEARAFALEMGISRNEPCPCGSGKKFKKCCAKSDED